MEKFHLFGAPGIFEEIKKYLWELASFLDIQVSEQVINQVIFGSRLDRMKKNELADCSWIKRNKNEAPHLRKGIVGDWRNYFTKEQNKRFDNLYSSRSKGYDNFICYLLPTNYSLLLQLVS